jgi:hypothetical protein
VSRRSDVNIIVPNRRRDLAPDVFEVEWIRGNALL